MLSFADAVPAAYSFYRDMPGDSYAQKPAQILKNMKLWRKIMNQDWLNRPELKELDPVKKKFLTELMEESEKTITKMNALRLKFTAQESALISEIIESQMSAQDRSRFLAVKKMLMK